MSTQNQDHHHFFHEKNRQDTENSTKYNYERHQREEQRLLDESHATTKEVSDEEYHSSKDPDSANDAFARPGNVNPYKTSTIKWWGNYNSMGILVLIMISAMTMNWFRYLNELFPEVHPALIGLCAGTMTTAWSIFFHVLVDPKMGVSTAVLMGLIVAEFSVYGCQLREEVVAPITVAFFFFMMLFGILEAKITYPEYYDSITVYHNPENYKAKGEH